MLLSASLAVMGEAVSNPERITKYASSLHFCTKLKLVSYQYNIQRNKEALLAIPDISHIYHIWDMWRQICHVEKYQISMCDKCGEN